MSKVLTAAEQVLKATDDVLKGKEDVQTPAPPRKSVKDVVNVSTQRGKGGKGAGADVDKTGKEPGIMRVANLAAGQHQGRASGKGGANAKEPQFSGAAATLGSGTTVRPYSMFHKL